MIEVSLLLLAFAFLVYLPCLMGEPVFDDRQVILDDVNVMSGGVTIHFRTPERSITKLSYALVVRWIPRAWMFPAQHVVNVLLHWGVALLAMPLAERLGVNSALVAFIIVAHPLAVSAVGPAGYRGAVLSQLWVLAAINAGLWHGWAALPFLVLAVLSKEDALGVFSLLALVRPYYWKRFWKLSGHAGKSIGGMPTSLPFRRYVPTAFVENLRHWVLWMVGLDQNVDHDVRLRRFGSGAFGAALVLFLFAVGLILIYSSFLLKVCLLLWLISPFPLYWFLPLPDPVAEVRAYGTIFPIALGIAGIAIYPVVWIAMFGAFACWRATCYASGHAYWSSAIRDGSRNHRARINLGGQLQGRGQLPEAEAMARGVITEDPNSPLAWTNLGLIFQAVANKQYVEACQALEQLGPASPVFHGVHAAAKDNFRQACAILETARSLDPKDKVVERYQAEVTGLAARLKMLD